MSKPSRWHIGQRLASPSLKHVKTYNSYFQTGSMVTLQKDPSRGKNEFNLVPPTLTPLNFQHRKFHLHVFGTLT